MSWSLCGEVERKMSSFDAATKQAVEEKMISGLVSSLKLQRKIKKIKKLKT
jgi:hypothetical protein